MEIDHENNMAPLAWDAWMKLEIREHDYAIGTAAGPVRIPTIIILKSFNKVPLFRPKFGLKSLWLRDGGVCQYSGKSLNFSDASIDHVMPQSRGGETSWENCVLCERLLNSQKGDKTPTEAGLKLRKTPREPKAVPVTLTLKNTLGIKDWQFFLLTKAA
jgi:5-methylcytosine-specific restriction endonuclease McrA